MTMTRSLIDITTSMSCSMTQTVTPRRSRSARMCSSSCKASTGATPAIGSSSRIIRGSTISARPSSSSLRWPPDSVPASSPASGDRKTRTRPARATRSPRHPSIRRPAKRMVPRSGLRKPEARLKTVVLPAPFGPITAVIEPSATAKEAPSTAATPPKALPTLSSSSSTALLVEQQLAAAAEQALGPQRHEQHQQQSDQEQAQEGARPGIEQRQREEVEEARAGIEQAEQHCPDRDCPHPVHAAENQDEIGIESERRLVVVGA